MSDSLSSSNRDMPRLIFSAKYDEDSKQIHLKAEKAGIICWIKANLLPASWVGHYKLDKITELMQTHSEAQIIADDTPHLIEALLFLKNKHVTETNPSKSTPKQIQIHSAVQSIFSDKRICDVTEFHALVSGLVKKAKGNPTDFAIDYSSHKELFKKKLKELIQSPGILAIDDTLNAIANIDKQSLLDLCTAVYADLDEAEKNTFFPYIQWANSLPQIPPEYQLQSLEVLKICQLAEKHFTAISSSTTPESFVYVKKEEAIARSVILDPKTRDIFILNKEKAGRPKMQGGFKKVTEVIRMPQYAPEKTQPVEVMVQLVNRDETTLEEKEINYFDLFRGQPNLMHSSNFVTYTKKKDGVEIAKTSLIQKKGLDLFDLMNESIQGEANIVTEIRKERSKQIAFIKGMASAVTALHTMTEGLENTALTEGLVHQDIKIENILIQIDSEGNPIPILTDFGMVTPTKDIKDFSRNPFYGTCFATAPEVLESQTHSNPQAEDMYALGHVFYTILPINSQIKEAPWTKALQDDSESLDSIIKQQKEISLKIENLEKLPSPLSWENEIALLTYRLLDPNPQTRLTALGLQQEIERIEQIV